VLLAGLFVLLPVERQTVDYRWAPADDGSRVPLLLIERTPDEFALAFPCALAAGVQRQLFASSRSPDAVPALVVSGGDARVIIEVPADQGEPAGEQISASLDVPADDCLATIWYDRATSHLAVRAGDDLALLDVSEDPFEVTGLHWMDESVDEVHAAVRTSPASAVRNSVPQKVVLAAIALLALGSLLAAGVRRRRRDAPRDLDEGGHRAPQRMPWRQRWRSCRLHPSEWAMLAIAAAVAVVDLPRVDDGRILSRARLLAGSGMEANQSVLVENQIVPQRWWYEWVLGTTVGWSSSVVVIRLLSVLAVALAWMLLRRRILPAVAGRQPAAAVVVTAWGVFAVFVVAWSATLRPEPLVILLTVIVLAVTASWPAAPRVWPSAVVVGAVGVAVATHVAGLAAALAALPAAVRAFGDLRRSAAPVVTGVAWGATVAVVSLFPGSNLPRTLAAVREFDEGGDHGYGAADVVRYLLAIQDSTAPMMLATGLGVVGLVAAGAAGAAGIRRLEHTKWSPAGAVVLGAALSPLALLFTPSKWLWHLAILAPVAVVGWILVARRLEQRPAALGALLAVAGAVLALLTAWSMRPAWNARMLTRWWREVGLREVSPDMWAEALPWLIGPEVRWWLWVMLLWAVMVAAALVVRTRRERLRGGVPLSSALLAGVAAVSVVQLTPPVADAVRSDGQWTFVRQSVAGLVATEAACGVPAATPALVQHAGASANPGFGAMEGAIAGHSGVYMFAPCHEAMRQRDGVWQVPRLLMGDLTHDQRRAVLEYDLQPIGCHPFPREGATESLCFREFVADGEPLAPTAARWSR
jgi:hypothetical protein